MQDAAGNYGKNGIQLFLPKNWNSVFCQKTEFHLLWKRGWPHVRRCFPTCHDLCGRSVDFLNAFFWSVKQFICFSTLSPEYDSKTVVSVKRLIKESFLFSKHCTVAHGYASDANCEWHGWGVRDDWAEKSDKNSFLFYFDGSWKASGASWVNISALLKHNTKRSLGYYEAWRRERNGERQAGGCLWRSWLMRVLKVFSSF